MPPSELLTSARCIVRTPTGLVACRSPDGWHTWPGGRLEPGETPRQAACREVAEETGLRLDPRQLAPVGFLHYRHLGPQPPDYRPYPDFAQLVFWARVDRGPDPAWSDLDAWELECREVPATDLSTLDLNPVQAAFAGHVLGEAHADRRR